MLGLVDMFKYIYIYSYIWWFVMTCVYRPQVLLDHHLEDTLHRKEQFNGKLSVDTLCRGI